MLAIGHRNLGLDFARSVAILLVVFSHGLPFMGDWPARLGLDGGKFGSGMGVLGVEIFFCLSGFLIGSILLDLQETSARGNSVRIFMVRRWMRTLPLYYLTLFALILVPAFDPSARHDVWRYVVFLQNFVTPMPGGNWFGTSWSLTIEEWSYVALPLLAFRVFKKTREPVALAAAALCVVAFGLRLALTRTNADWDLTVRKMMETRLDAIAYGVLLAWLLRNGGERVERWLTIAVPISVCVLAISLWTVVDAHRAASFFGRIFALPLMAAAICACLPLLSRLRLPDPIGAAVRFVAKISYSLYLVHWPCMMLTAAFVASWQWACYAGSAFALATVVSFSIEQPIMRLRPRQQDGRGQASQAPSRLRRILKGSLVSSVR
jgi:peptidoglycan/LPS O-acetylase OafA/YrhL